MNIDKFFVINNFCISGSKTNKLHLRRNFGKIDSKDFFYEIT